MSTQDKRGVLRAFLILLVFSTAWNGFLDGVPFWRQLGSLVCGVIAWAASQKLFDAFSEWRDSKAAAKAEAR